MPTAHPATIATEHQLRALIPEPSSKIRLKILARLERHSRFVIEHSTIVALATNGVTGLDIRLLAGSQRVVVRDDTTIEIADPDGSLAGAPAGAGLLFMVPGICETLRVNGRTSATRPGHVTISIDEVFLQCPKAFVRSDLWQPASWRAGPPADAGEVVAELSADLTGEMTAFVADSPFAVLATTSAAGNADVSPRGDPRGAFVRVLDARTLLVPDRTGNHLVDSLRNILSNPRAAIAFVIPGEPRTLHVDGRASLTADAAMLAPSAVQHKAPKIGVVIEIERARFTTNSLVGVWRRDALVDPKTFPSLGEMILDQVNPGGKTLNRIGSALFDLGSAYHKKRRLY